MSYLMKTFIKAFTMTIALRGFLIKMDLHFKGSEFRFLRSSILISQIVAGDKNMKIENNINIEVKIKQIRVVY